jgi:hypothetical protein
VLVEIDGAVVGKDVLLDGLVHVSTHSQKVLWVILVTGHLLDARAVTQETFLVSHVALHHLLVAMLLLAYAFVELANVLNRTGGTSCNLSIYSMSSARYA